MKVSIRLLGHLSTVAKEEHVVFNVGNGATVVELIKRLTEGLGEEFKREVVGPTSMDPRTNCLIMVNDREIGALDGLQTELRKGDVVSIVPVSHGG